MNTQPVRLRITAMIILFSAVQMYEFSYIHFHNEISFAILCLLSFISHKSGGGGGAKAKAPQALPLRGPCYSLELAILDIFNERNENLG